eukprot:10690806-Alexandrium_andersonii.AAC.1
MTDVTDVNDSSFPLCVNDAPALIPSAIKLISIVATGYHRIVTQPTCAPGRTAIFVTGRGACKQQNVLNFELGNHVDAPFRGWGLARVPVSNTSTL